MRAVIFFFILWAVAGAVYFVYDSVQNEYSWTRGGVTWTEIFLAGPIIWVFSTYTYIACGLLWVFEYLRGRAF